jgi:hypothetical protein
LPKTAIKGAPVRPPRQLVIESIFTFRRLFAKGAA